jgi:HlyD family secretion protein
MPRRKLNSIVRKEALEDFSSSELLYQRLVVVAGKGWLLLVVIISVIVLSLLWAIIGVIPITVNGQGIILDVQTPLVVQNPYANGAVVKISPVLGDVVEADEILALIADPVMESNLKTARSDLELLQANDRRATASEENVLNKQQETVRRQLEATFSTLERTRKLMKLYQKQVADQQSLSDKNLIPISQLIATQSLLFSAEEEEKTQFSSLSKLESDLASRESELVMNRQQRAEGIKTKEIEVERFTIELTKSQVIRSPIRGRLIEIEVTEGSFVTPGSQIATIIPLDDEVGQGRVGVFAISFVAYGTGKQIKPGMLARLGVPYAPTTEYGFIEAKVTEVSEYALDEEEVSRQVGSKSLAKKIMSATSVPLRVTLELKYDSSTQSGLAWTSKEGFPGKIPPLTECTVQITTRTQRPIDIILPWLKKQVGVDTDIDISSGDGSAS